MKAMKSGGGSSWQYHIIKSGINGVISAAASSEEEIKRECIGGVNNQYEAASEKCK